MQEFFFIIRAAKDGQPFKDHEVVAHGKDAEDAKEAALALLPRALVVNVETVQA